MNAKFIGKARLTGHMNISKDSEVYWYEFNDILVLVKEIVNPRELAGLILGKRRRK